MLASREMASDRFLGIFLSMIPMLLLLSSSSSSHATAAMEFSVGGKDGWAVKPSEDYNHWAQRHRFQVNDTLRFRYKKGSDSVLVVNKKGYDSCNTNNPKQKMESGDSTFKLGDSGLYFFISGKVDNCKHGEKLIVLVMAVRHSHPPAAHAPAPAPSSQQPASGLLPSVIPSSSLVTPAQSPSNISSKASPVGGVGVWVVLMFTGFAGLAY